MSFESGQRYWVFSQEVTQSNRYIYSDAIKNFLSNVLETGETRVTPVSSGSILWLTAPYYVEWRKSSIRLEVLYVQLDNKEYRSSLARLFVVSQRVRQA